MGQIIGITKVKNPYKFIRLLKRNHPNIPNNKFDELIFDINNNDFTLFIRCEENEIRSISEYCDLFIKSSKYMKQNQFEFKPFDRVLVRDFNTQQWRCGIFSHYGETEEFKYACVGHMYAQCIPYNENTAHLLGTCEPYKEPQPKEWEIRSSNGMYVDKFTSSELENFIKTAVINNKDITNFTVTRIF